jgi:enoyl-CoA hydratase/carnithine racemase
MELLLSGRFFTGQEAADIGLASVALPAAEVLPAALKYARELAACTGPTAVALTKQFVYESLTQVDRELAFEREVEATWWTGEQPDTAEGVAALLEKRPARWAMSKHDIPRL